MIFVSRKALEQTMKLKGANIDEGTLALAIHELETVLPPHCHPYVTEADVVAAAQARNGGDYAAFLKRLGEQCGAGDEWMEAWHAH